MSLQLQGARGAIGDHGRVVSAAAMPVVWHGGGTFGVVDATLRRGWWTPRRSPLQPMVGITNSAPARMPVGQRLVMVFSRV